MSQIDLSIFSPYENLFQTDVPLSKFAFSLCGGPGSEVIKTENSEILEYVIKCCIKAGYPYKVLGGMTNILISDKGFDGIVLLNRKGKISHKIAEDGSVILYADSGTGMAAVVRYCIENEISGMEWAAGLPGTVGGAVCGNAGAFGAEVKDVFFSGRMLDEHGEIYQLSPEKMDFAYRSSVMKNQKKGFILLDASFLLWKDNKRTILSKTEEYKDRRKNTQPVDEHSLGSVFKNPEGGFAGKLIQEAGLKGFSIGKATVSLKHANFITTEKGVTSEDYHRLICHIQNKVYEQFSVLLEPEIELFGFEVL